MENIVLQSVMYTITNNQIFDSNNTLVYTISGSVIKDVNDSIVYNIIDKFVIDLNNNLVYILDNGKLFSFDTIDEYSLVNGEIVDVSGNIIHSTKIVVTDDNVVTTTMDAVDGTSTINIVDTKLTSDNLSVSNVQESVVNYYDDDPEVNSILTEINSYASKIDISDFQKKGRIEDYLSLIQNAQNVVNQNKTYNLDVDLTQYNSLGTVADELTGLFNQLTVNVQQESTMLNKDFLNGLLSTMRKLYNLSDAFGKFKKVMTSESVLNVPKSLSNVENTLKTVSSTLASASSYITYFADSSSITDETVISNSQLSASDLNNIHKSIDLLSTSQTNMNNLINERVSVVTSNINSLSSNITSLSNSLNKLRQKIGNN
jgi:hypothetical protein